MPEAKYSPAEVPKSTKAPKIPHANGSALPERKYSAVVVPDQPGPLKPQTIAELARRGKIEENPDASHEEKDRPRIKERISEEEKTRIFTPVAEAMQQLAAQHGVTIPPTESLIARILVVDKTTFEQLAKTEIGENHGVSVKQTYGYNLYNRLAVLNYDRISEIAEKGQLENLLTEYGMHELWHSVMYKELWQPNPNNPLVSEYQKIRREGFATGKPENTETSIGLSILVEGFTQYLTRETQRIRGHGLVNKSSYLEELGTTDSLIQHIGEPGLEALFQAAFTKRGFRKFAHQLNPVFSTKKGKRETLGVVNLAKRAYADSEHNQMSPSHQPRARSTRRFIEDQSMEYEMRQNRQSQRLKKKSA